MRLIIAVILFCILAELEGIKNALEKMASPSTAAPGTPGDGAGKQTNTKENEGK